MVKQNIWIGIVIGAFLVGIVGTYAVSAVSYGSPMMGNNQFMQQMINDPQTMQNTMNQMMNDPNLRQQMMSSMKQNQQFMQDVMQNNQMGNMMGNSMMKNGMTGSSMMNPELSSFMKQQIQEHQQFLQHRMSSNWDDPDFQEPVPYTHLKLPTNR